MRRGISWLDELTKHDQENSLLLGMFSPSEIGQGGSNIGTLNQCFEQIYIRNIKIIVVKFSFFTA